MMYPKFIELHDKGAGDLFGININHIVSFGKDGIILTGIPTDIALATAESYDEIKQLIQDTGTLIHRADPRLDETHRLTMADLKEMIGEPVWDAEKRRWYLVVDSALDNDAWLDLVDDCGKIHHLTELDFRRGGWRLFREKRMTED